MASSPGAANVSGWTGSFARPAVVRRLRALAPRRPVSCVLPSRVGPLPAASGVSGCPARCSLVICVSPPAYGVMRMFDSPAVATPVGESRSNTQVFGALLERLGLVRAGDAMTDEELIAAVFAATEYGPSLKDQIETRGVAEPSKGARPIMFVDAFPGTPDRKVHLLPAALDAEAKGLYVYKPDPRTESYPLALISPALATQISSTFGQLRTAPGELEMSPADASSRGIKSGDHVRVWNDLGEVRCVVVVDAAIREGVCVIPKGLWRKHTDNGFTANALIPQTTADIGGQAAFNDARVQVALA